MKYKIGDELYFNNEDSNARTTNGPCIVVSVDSKRSYSYKVNIIGGDYGWLAREDELRTLTKLDRALS